jgi:hypothetical protein
MVADDRGWGKGGGVRCDVCQVEEKDGGPSGTRATSAWIRRRRATMGAGEGVNGRLTCGPRDGLNEFKTKSDSFKVRSFQKGPSRARNI